jgi:hypothetical protein
LQTAKEVGARGGQFPKMRVVLSLSLSLSWDSADAYGRSNFFRGNT